MTTWRDDERVLAKRNDVVQCASTMLTDNDLDGWQGNVNLNLALDAYAEAVASAVLAEVPCEVWADRHRKCMDEEHFSGPCDCRCGPCRSRAERAKRKEAP